MQAADSFLVDSNCLILKYLISNYLSVKTFVLSRAKIHKEREIFKTVCCVKCKYSQYFHSYFALLVWNSSKRKENVAKKREQKTGNQRKTSDRKRQNKRRQNSSLRISYPVTLAQANPRVDEPLRVCELRAQFPWSSEIYQENVLVLRSQTTTVISGLKSEYRVSLVLEADGF